MTTPARPGAIPPCFDQAPNHISADGGLWYTGGSGSPQRFVFTCHHLWYTIAMSFRRTIFPVVTLAVLCFAQPAGITGVAVAEALRTANVFPKSNQITDTTGSLMPADKSDGALSGATIASNRTVTIKVYKSSAARNQARLRMVKECPGCNSMTECGTILIYTPLFDRAPDMNQILHRRSREYHVALSKRYGCP